MFKRVGECNQCGECCGYPRFTGGQNNPWPNEWPEVLADMSKDVLKESIPLFKLVSHPKYGGKRSGHIEVDGVICHWIWVKHHGLCTDLFPYGKTSNYDIRCPFLSRKLEDDTVPCLVYNSYPEFWQKMCMVTPPATMSFKEEVDEWYENCPSCSYRYIEE